MGYKDNLLSATHSIFTIKLQVVPEKISNIKGFYSRFRLSDWKLTEPTAQHSQFPNA